MVVRMSFVALASALVALAAHGQPRDPNAVIAVVLGQEITVADAERSPITGLIGDALTRKFVEDNGLEPTDEEVSAFVEGSRRAQRRNRLAMERHKVELEEALEGTLDPERRESLRDQLDIVTANVELLSESRPEVGIEAERAMAVVWVQRWKFFKALYDKYGGRAHYQQAGVEPVRRGARVPRRTGGERRVHGSRSGLRGRVLALLAKRGNAHVRPGKQGTRADRNAVVADGGDAR